MILNHFKPSEFILPTLSCKNLSTETLEALKKFASKSISAIRWNYSESLNDKAEISLLKVTKWFTSDYLDWDIWKCLYRFSTETLSSAIVIAYVALYEFLEDFGIENMLIGSDVILHQFKGFEKMFLNSSTIESLEIFQTCDSKSTTGTLFWLLDQTQTLFGSRELKSWISSPLIDLKELEERRSAIDELRHLVKSGNLDPLLKLMSNLPDLERALIRIKNFKSTPEEFVTTIRNLDSISKLKVSQSMIFKSDVGRLLRSFEKIRGGVVYLASLIDMEWKKSSDDTLELITLFRDLEKFEELLAARKVISPGLFGLHNFFKGC
ncbi:Mismatch repair protein msh3 [Nowakowskiella sp. JEL0078]|nr:Mismatch repair protein msh3 [Nowakowskiella sp. JEL0078]